MSPAAGASSGVARAGDPGAEAHRYDALLVDLDGTVYRGPEAIAHAVEALEAARSRGLRVGYVTNNASRAATEVRDHLAELGLTVDADDVVTSAQAAARVLAERGDDGDAVLVVGTEALADEVRAAGRTPVRRADADPAAVVQGHSPETGWADLAEAGLVLRAGARWVACNVDATLPTGRGLLPGNGAMVAALRVGTDREPEVAGKPAAPLLRHAVDRTGARRPLVIGDRLDTDIAGAHAVDADSLLVLTGVSTPGELLRAPADRRPTYVAADLTALDGDLDAARVPAPSDWHVTTEGDAGAVRVELRGSGDPTAALRALCAAGWEAAGDEGADVTVRAGDDAAADALAALGLTPR